MHSRTRRTAAALALTATSLVTTRSLALDSVGSLASCNGALEGGFVPDLACVAVHVGMSSARASALFRSGSVVIGDGRYGATSQGGQQLQSHEVSHVTQQGTVTTTQNVWSGSILLPYAQTPTAELAAQGGMPVQLLRPAVGAGDAYVLSPELAGFGFALLEQPASNTNEPASGRLGPFGVSRVVVRPPSAAGLVELEFMHVQGVPLTPSPTAVADTPEGLTLDSDASMDTFAREEAGAPAEALAQAALEDALRAVLSDVVHAGTPRERAAIAAHVRGEAVEAAEAALYALVSAEGAAHDRAAVGGVLRDGMARAVADFLDARGAMPFDACVARALAPVRRLRDVP